MGPLLEFEGASLLIVSTTTGEVLDVKVSLAGIGSHQRPNTGIGENAIATADGKDCQAVEQPIADRNGTGVQTGARRGDGQLTGQRPFPRGISR